MRENSGIGLYELQERIKGKLAIAFPHKFWIKGEVSAVKENISGHCYLDIIDKNQETGVMNAKAQGIIWASTWKVLRPYFEKTTGASLAAGMEILFMAQVQYSELYGLSLIISDIDPSYSVGEMEMLRLKTIERLQKEGMMEMNASLKLPPLPRRFAVISSETAAGYRDFMKHLHNNEYGFKFLTQLFPAPMQGAAAPEGIISALDSIVLEINEKGARFDAVLILRGGGAVTDLACFDDYSLASNVAQFPLPVMVAVGHDQDYHICDMVACVSVKTPTALADYLVDIFVGEDAEISSLASRLAMALANKGREADLVLENLSGRLLSGVHHRFMQESGRLDLLEQRVQKGNPLHIIASGYALARKDGVAVDSVEKVAADDKIEVVFRDGYLKCTVNETIKIK